jgi:acetoin utilization deacetylase AcuC-like enzyme
MGYGLDKQIHHIYDPRPATKEELENYHDSDYIDFLSRSRKLDFQIMLSFLTKILLQSYSTKSKFHETDD